MTPESQNESSTRNKELSLLISQSRTDILPADSVIELSDWMAEELSILEAEYAEFMTPSSIRRSNRG